MVRTNFTKKDFKIGDSIITFENFKYRVCSDKGKLVLVGNNNVIYSINAIFKRIKIIKRKQIVIVNRADENSDFIFKRIAKVK